MLENFISVDQLNLKLIDKIFQLVKDMPSLRCKRDPVNSPLAGYVLANIFFEASTRSRMSFHSAFTYLGGQVNSSTGVTFSSISKGESLEDTIKVISSYCDILVIRHPDVGSAKIAAESAQVPVINAGDGHGEHPTQALLDLYTIFKEKGGLKNLHILLMGDLKYGRTVHSLVRLLALYPGIRFTFVAPEELQLSEPLKRFLNEKGLDFHCSDDLDAALPSADVIYSTRIQKERFADPAKANTFEGRYILNKQRLEQYAKKEVCLLHPLPRLSEISSDVDALPQAAYFRQAENGLYVRMALFLLMLNP